MSTKGFRIERVMETDVTPCLSFGGATPKFIAKEVWFLGRTLFGAVGLSWPKPCLSSVLRILILERLVLQCMASV